MSGELKLKSRPLVASFIDARTSHVSIIRSLTFSALYDLLGGLLSSQQGLFLLKLYPSLFFFSNKPWLECPIFQGGGCLETSILLQKHCIQTRTNPKKTKIFGYIRE